MKELASTRPTPVVSIGMPVYNCALTVAQAVRSILNQTFEDWELIIIDDGSTDGTLETVALFEDPRVVVFPGKANKGLPARLNECVEKARGKYFARMDGDDIAYPQRLRKQVEYLESHLNVDLVGAAMIVFRGCGEAYGSRPAALSHQAICGNVLSGLRLAHPTWVGKAKWFRLNPYRSGFWLTEDRELLMRTRNTSNFAALPEPLLGYRENRVCLEKIVSARYHLCRAFLEDAVMRGGLLYGLGGAIAEGLKAVLDVAAVGTGLQDMLLSHRARPLPRELREEWLNVWRETSG